MKYYKYATLIFCVTATRVFSQEPAELSSLLTGPPTLSADLEYILFSNYAECDAPANSMSVDYEIRQREPYDELGEVSLKQAVERELEKSGLPNTEESRAFIRNLIISSTMVLLHKSENLTVSQPLSETAFICMRDKFIAHGFSPVPTISLIPLGEVKNKQ